MRVCLGSSRIALLSNKRGLRRKRRADVPNAGAKGTRMERSYIGSILCLPTASALPTDSNGDFGMSLFYGQLSDKPPLACKTHMGLPRQIASHTPAVPIAPRPSLVRLKVERKDLAWVPVPPRAGRYLIITLRFLLTLSVGFSCLFR